ncbi:tgb1 [[Candida] subhashii]|uniref:Tgb1 n=1 Tax=[Candida] subhashii TaxID=561895 RepID=A0A8J5QRF0_9ASCO|nr:tgb1 [[Candida] subhashii]KAG7663907.1 tgb1 [[Candida] subhashii]
MSQYATAATASGNNMNLPIEKQIEFARNEARTLYNEIITIKKRTQDTTLGALSRNVTHIPRNSCNLKLYNTLKGHQNKIAKLTWSADSSKILSAAQDGYMIIWDAITGYKKHAIELDNMWVLTCSFSPNEKLAASAGLDNVCTIYKIKSDTENPISAQRGSSIPLTTSFYQSVESMFRGHTAYISQCEFIDNKSIITGSGDMTCALWDISKGKKSRDFIDHVGDVLTLTTFPQNLFSNNLFVSGSSDGYAKVWDLRSPTPAQNFFVSHSDVNCLKVFPDGNAFASGSDDGLIRLFDLRSDCELSNYSLASELHNRGLESFPQMAVPATPGERRGSGGRRGGMFSGQQMFGNGNDAMTDQYSTMASLNSTSEAEKLGLFSLDFGKSGRFIYSCYSAYGCIVWDTLKNEVVGTVGTEHADKITQVAISPDGSALATGSWDTTIKVWSV